MSISFYVGFPGSGKTTLASLHARAYVARGWDLVVWDPTGDVSRYLHGVRFRDVTNEPDAVVSLRDSVFFCDEAETLWPSNIYARDPLRMVFEHARNRHLVILATTRRPQAVSPALRSLASHVYVFRLQSRVAIEGLQECFDPRLAREAFALGRGEYLYRGPWPDRADTPLLRGRVRLTR